MAMDEAFREKHAPTAAEQVQGLSLFELVQRVQVDPPSVPSGASERGADKAKKRQPAQQARIIDELAKAGCLPNSGKYLSRDAIVARTGLTVNAACGRLAPSGGLLMPKGTDEGPWAIRAKEDAATSNDGGLVLGYQLTRYGVGLLEEAGKLRLVEAA